MARLDRLGAAKEIAQIGATIGREFNYDVLHAVSPLAEDTLQQGLRQLVEAELAYQNGRLPQATYLFKHALIQDTAYQSLLKSRRQQLHRQIAQILEQRFPETVETQPELIAHHYTEAGLIEKAIPYWQQAGQRAFQRSANVEVIRHLTTALELLKTLSDTPKNTQQELDLQIALGSALIPTKGWAAPEVEKAYTRARELCQQVGETAKLFPVLFGLWIIRLNRAEFQTAREFSEQLLTLAQGVQDAALLLEANLALGYSLFWLGEFTDARTHLEQGIALYDSQRHHALAFLYAGFDPGVACLSCAAQSLWHLGYPDQALKKGQEALLLARELSHSPSLIFALGFAPTYFLRREGQLAREWTEEVMTLSAEQGAAAWLAIGTIVRGWALTEQGQVEEGVAQMQQGLSACRATGQAGWQPSFLALLAEIYGKVGQIETGLAVLTEALARVDKSGERICEAELYRLRGELTLQKFQVQDSKFQVENPQSVFRNPQSEAEACFFKSLEVAREQQAKSWELRTSISLARLWQQQGKQKEAHEMLVEIYNWFTEGFDTKDLQEAKALIEELSHLMIE
jgi:predicted ATPase